MSEVDFNQYGYVVIASLYGNALLAIMGVGVHVFISVYSLSTLLSSPRGVMKARAPYIAVGLVIFVLYTLMAALDAYGVFSLMFGSASGQDILAKGPTFDQQWFRVMSTFMFLLAMFIGDGVMLYRCSVIWQDRRWVLIVPGLCYLASIGLGMRVGIPATYEEVATQRKIFSAFIFLSVLFNIMITSLICFRLLRARNIITSVLGTRRHSLYTRAVVILIEAALPVAIFGLGEAVLLALPRGGNTWEMSAQYISHMFFSGFYYLFATLSPQMIIFRVATGRSWANTTDIGNSTTISVESASTLEKGFVPSLQSREKTRIDITSASTTINA
ncbi:hypothetical protein FA15DRAFT_698385 [Coprinopsis marcescibilis]|uniref:Uncharacterized protein n=1 Tax=Coprinopsis marcescibilis TaxID=230819 RepID=A0A5C3KCH4_COPMA|nr:hypothetical protein FA15DRAFT_698385 [Coprinopsis marcescibilis]